jgi:polyisoprenoid-binding protein YceI
MNNSIILFGLLVSFSTFAQTAVVEVSLSPAGSFNLKSSEVKGAATVANGVYTASNVKVGLGNIQTGIALRDTHAKKRLEVEKFPDAELISATGKDGKGTGQIKIKGITQKIAGTYKIDNSHLVATFPLKLSDFKITDVRYMGVGADDTVNVTITLPVNKKN